MVQKNVATETAKVIAKSLNEKQSVECFLSEEISRTILVFMNRKVKKVYRTLPRLRKINTNTFSIDELQAAVAIILRAGSNRNNFSDVGSLWMPSDSEPFYRAVMSLDRSKFFLTSL